MVDIDTEIYLVLNYIVIIQAKRNNFELEKF